MAHKSLVSLFSSYLVFSVVFDRSSSRWRCLQNACITTIQRIVSGS